ncbi:MAG: putative sporulation protein YtxC [Clostridiaceae bacterium]|jgi:putative sporulation protein YtxC|nr:putative sporulation protein YtxC [Clostridiaceae bacterium]
MQFLCIGVNGSTDLVMQHINEELRQLKNKKISYSINEINSEGSASIICTINDGRFYREKSLESYKVLKTYISNALADYIIRQYEEKLIMRIINSNFCYFNAVEKKEILQRALSIIRNEDKTFINSLFQIRRRNVIVRRLMDYFDNSNSIILDGFVNFRLKDYIRNLEEIVDKAVDDFLMDREYREFIRLLRYFVEIQEPKIDTVHVIVNYDNKYTLLDGSKREITNECIQEYVNEITEGEINYDDLLVSSLITFAPRKVVIHSMGHSRNKELMETIKNVFYGRVIICQGCELCSMRMAKSETKK